MTYPQELFSVWKFYREKEENKMLTKETVAQITKDFGRKEGDTGSVEYRLLY